MNVSSRRATLRYVQENGIYPTAVAGLRYLTTVGGSGLVGVYRNDEAGLDDGSAGYDGATVDIYPWSTVCELHCTVVSHLTYKVAVAHASDVLSWCDECAETETPYDNGDSA